MHEFVKNDSNIVPLCFQEIAAKAMDFFCFCVPYKGWRRIQKIIALFHQRLAAIGRVHIPDLPRDAENIGPVV